MHKFRRPTVQTDRQLPRSTSYLPPKEENVAGREVRPTIKLYDAPSVFCNGKTESGNPGMSWRNQVFIRHDLGFRYL